MGGYWPKNGKPGSWPGSGVRVRFALLVHLGRVTRKPRKPICAVLLNPCKTSVATPYLRGDPTTTSMAIDEETEATKSLP